MNEYKLPPDTVYKNCVAKGPVTKPWMCNYCPLLAYGPSFTTSNALLHLKSCSRAPEDVRLEAAKRVKDNLQPTLASPNLQRTPGPLPKLRPMRRPYKVSLLASSPIITISDTETSIELALSDEQHPHLLLPRKPILAHTPACMVNPLRFGFQCSCSSTESKEKESVPMEDDSILPPPSSPLYSQDSDQLLEIMDSEESLVPFEILPKLEDIAQMLKPMLDIGSDVPFTPLMPSRSPSPFLPPSASPSVLSSQI